MIERDPCRPSFFLENYMLVLSGHFQFLRRLNEPKNIDCLVRQSKNSSNVAGPTGSPSRRLAQNNLDVTNQWAPGNCHFIFNEPSTARTEKLPEYRGRIDVSMRIAGAWYSVSDGIFLENTVVLVIASE